MTMSEGTTETTGILGLAFALGAPVAFCLCLLLMRAYRRAVVRGMAATGRGAAPNAALGVDGTLTSNARRAGWASEWRAARRRSWWGFVVAGVTFASTQAVLLLWLSHTEPLPVRCLMMGLVDLWPLLLLSLMRLELRLGLTLVGLYAAVLAVCGALAGGVLLPFTMLLGFQLVPTLLVTGFLWHRVRAVGPTSLAFVLLLVVGGNLGLHWLSNNVAAASEAGAAVGSNATLLVSFVVLVGALLASLFGLALLRAVAKLQEGRLVTDETLTVDGTLLVFSLLFSSNLVFAANEPVAGFWALVPFASFVIVRSLFRRLAPSASDYRPPRLLFLRVFASAGEAAKLWSALGRTWRFAGPLRMIGGPDLATSTIETHRYLDYLRGRLAQRFVQDGGSLERALLTLDERRIDGRYGVSELFCNDNVWRTAFTRLAATSDVILMDLRGFGAGRAGATYELEELTRSGALARALLLVDAKTEQRLVDEVVAAASRFRIAPRTLRFEGMRPDAEQLMAALLDAAGAPQPGKADGQRVREG